jgi:hypothetical protein
VPHKSNFFVVAISYFDGQRIVEIMEAPPKQKILLKDGMLAPLAQL